MLNRSITLILDKINTNQELAKIAGLGKDTIRKVKTIEAKASVETKEKLKAQEISINQAYKEIKKVPKVPKVQLYKTM